MWRLGCGVTHERTWKDPRVMRWNWIPAKPHITNTDRTGPFVFVFIFNDCSLRGSGTSGWRFRAQCNTSVVHGAPNHLFHLCTTRSSCHDQLGERDEAGKTCTRRRRTQFASEWSLSCDKWLHLLSSELERWRICFDPVAFCWQTFSRVAVCKPNTSSQALCSAGENMSLLLWEQG